MIWEYLQHFWSGLISGGFSGIFGIFEVLIEEFSNIAISQQFLLGSDFWGVFRYFWHFFEKILDRSLKKKHGSLRYGTRYARPSAPLEIIDLVYL